MSFSYYEQKYTIPPYVCARTEKALFQTLHAKYFPVGGGKLGRQLNLRIRLHKTGFKCLRPRADFHKKWGCPCVDFRKRPLDCANRIWLPNSDNPHCLACFRDATCMQFWVESYPIGDVCCELTARVWKNLVWREPPNGKEAIS